MIKPFVGEQMDGPSDAAVICPFETRASREGVVIGHGICPRFSDFDAYHMAANAVDEAIRNCICVGADPSHLAILDNFCWPDPVFDPISNSGWQNQISTACEG